MTYFILVDLSALLEQLLISIIVESCNNKFKLTLVNLLLIFLINCSRATSF